PVAPQTDIPSGTTDVIFTAQLGKAFLTTFTPNYKLHSLIHDALSSPRHRQLLLALQTTLSTVKDVMITICKGCHDNEHTECRPYNQTATVVSACLRQLSTTSAR